LNNKKTTHLVAVIFSTLLLIVIISINPKLVRAVDFFSCPYFSPTAIIPGAFTPPTNLTGIRQKIIDEAQKEFDAKVCGTGSQQNEGDPQKYVKYACGLSPSDWPWCAGFAGWVYGHAGASFPHTCAANGMMDSLKYKYDITTKIPKPGDMIQKDHHIGIVYNIVGTRLYTIEGNAGACVMIKSYPNYGRGTWLRFGNSFEAE